MNEKGFASAKSEPHQASASRKVIVSEDLRLTIREHETSPLSMTPCVCECVCIWKIDNGLPGSSLSSLSPPHTFIHTHTHPRHDGGDF